MIISIPFLLITLIVYLLFPELHNLHGKCFMCYLLSLMIGYLTLSYVNIAKPHLGWLCTTLGYVAYISFMSAFLWLNVISFDLWRNFSSMSRSCRKNGRKTFIFYSLYSWGATALFTLLCFTLDQTDIYFKPAIGFESCFLQRKIRPS